MPKFINVPKNLLEKLVVEKKLKDEEEKKKETEEETVAEENETVEEEEKPVEEKETVENPDEKKDDEEVVEEENDDNKEEEKQDETEEEEDEKKQSSKMITKTECERRVSGMQSTMAKQMDTMRRQYEAKISEFEIKAKALNEELERVTNESISLKTTLEKTEKELSETISAFEEKKTALASLNASVNQPNQISETKPWKNLHGEALLKWCRENQNR